MDQEAPVSEIPEAAQPTEPLPDTSAPEAPATAQELLGVANQLVQEAERFARSLRRYGLGGGGAFGGCSDRIDLLVRVYRAVCQIAASEVQAARTQQLQFNLAVQRLESKQREPVLLQVQNAETGEVADSYWVDVLPGGPSQVFLLHPPVGSTAALDQETVDRFAQQVEQRDPSALVASVPPGCSVTLLRPTT